MSYLRFNPYYSLRTFSTSDNRSEFPLDEGEIVTMQLSVAGPIILDDDRKRDEDLSRINNPKLEFQLFPKIVADTDDPDCGLAEVKLNDGKNGVILLPFVYSLTNILQAIILENDEFDLLDPQFVTVPLVVEIIKNAPLTSQWKWVAYLTPNGKEVDGVIIAEVELTNDK